MFCTAQLTNQEIHAVVCRMRLLFLIIPVRFPCSLLFTSFELNF